MGKKKALPQAVVSGPLRIGDMVLDSYVLDDETRVLSQRGMLRTLSITRAGYQYGSSNKRGDILPPYLAAKRLIPFIPKRLLAETKRPIIFRPTHGGRSAYGLNATALPDICRVWIRARDAGVLTPNQARIAGRAEILLDGLAHVGIIALVDEATGYQKYRAHAALAALLEKYLRDRLGPWVKTFPDEYYEHYFRLRGWDYKKKDTKRPGIVGKDTVDIVYLRLAPGVLDELRRRTPRDSKGRLKSKYFQWLTEDVGHPALREHLIGVMALMRASINWGAFYRALQMAYPREGDNIQILIDEELLDKKGR